MHVGPVVAMESMPRTATPLVFDQRSCDATRLAAERTAQHDVDAEFGDQPADPEALTAGMQMDFVVA